jgi:hypothetical protein
MSTHHRLVRWTFTRFRNWSAGLSDARILARRYRELAHRTIGSRVQRAKRIDLRAGVLANAL